MANVVRIAGQKRSASVLDSVPIQQPIAPDFTYLAPGGVLPIPLSDKLDEIVSVTGWMAVPYDSEGDHTDWLQNVIEKVHSEIGGANVGVDFPHPFYQISDTLLNPYDNILLAGRGAGVNRGTLDAIRATAATRILWAGGAKPMVEIAPSSGSQWFLQGGGLRGLMLDGNNIATRCLSVLSSRFLRFTDIHCFAAAQAMIYIGQIDGTLVHPVYGSAYHVWDRVRAHAGTFASNAAYALRMVGGRGAGATTPDNSTLNQFFACQFTSQQQHAVSLENADGHDFYGGAMTSLGGGATQGGSLVTGFGGLELCSSDQSSGFGNGVPRNIRFFGPQINDAILRAGQTGGNSPHEIEFYGWQYGNAGGTILVEVPGGGAPAPHAVVYDQKNGITVYGSSVNPYKLHGISHMHLVDGVPPPATESGFAKDYVDVTGGSRKTRFGDGTIRVTAPKANVLAQTVTPLPNGAGAQVATLNNGPAAGNPTKWIPIDDNGVTRWIPVW